MNSTTAQVAAYLNDRRTIGAFAPSTAAHTRGQLYAFTAFCPEDPSRISRQHVLRWMATTSHLAKSTKRLYYARVKGFCDWLLRRGLLRRDPFLDVPAPKLPRVVHRSLEVEQAQALLVACVHPRDTVVVILGLHVGLRSAEMAALEIGDISLSARTLFVRYGKGGHERLLPLSHEAAVVVGQYVASQALSSGPLIRSLSEPWQGIKAGTVQRIFSRVAWRSGVKVRAGDRVASHSLRHTFATVTHEASGDIVAVSELLGHQSLNTTRRYVRSMSVERLRSAVEHQHYLGGAA